MKVLDYTTYSCLLNFLITLFGLALQEGWRDLGDNYVTTVLYPCTHTKGRPVSTVQKECLQLDWPCETGGNRCGRGTLSVLTAGRALFGVCFLKK